MRQRRAPLEGLIQFNHPEKALRLLPGVSDATISALWGVDEQELLAARAAFAARARGAAEELLADPRLGDQVDRLPFSPGATIVGLGDSITDDLQSWLEILRRLLLLRRPADGVTVVNAGVSGDTTAHMISRFLDVVALQPEWILCMAGTNDARLHGEQPSKTLVSIEETAANFEMLVGFAARQTAARWAWLTPASVLPERIAADPLLGPLQLGWRNEDLEAVAEVVRRQPGPVVDLRRAFGLPLSPALLLPDGLHPSLAGQKLIAAALVERLSGE